MSLADLKQIDIKHLERMPHYIVLGIGLILIGVLLIVAGIVL